MPSHMTTLAVEISKSVFEWFHQLPIILLCFFLENLASNCLMNLWISLISSSISDYCAGVLIQSNI